jgi:hypothetical protein
MRLGYLRFDEDARAAIFSSAVRDPFFTRA